jgi:iron complex outermembrane recepter protein
MTERGDKEGILMNHDLKLGRHLAVVASALLIATITPPARAAEANEPVSTIEEIVVTARKREEPLQESPVAVTALTGETLERTFSTDISDLNGSAPNVMIEGIGAFSSSAAVFMRGVGNADIDSSIDPPVAIFVDGIYIPRPANSSIDMFDVEQVEVLRGPQGTLFGRNTTGGALHIRTRRPGNEFATRGSITVGEYGRRDLRAAAEAPVVEGVLAAKVAVFSQQFDGFFKNEFTGAPGNRSREKIGGTDSLNVRPMIHFTPNDTFEATLIGEWLKERSDPNPLVNISTPTQLVQRIYRPATFAPGQDVRHVNYNLSPGQIDNDIWGLTLEMNWEVFGGTVTSVSKPIHSSKKKLISSMRRPLKSFAMNRMSSSRLNFDSPGTLATS